MGAGTYTIGKLAEAAGVIVETVRYYERRGLLEQPERPGAGYRRYTEDDLWRLQFIGRGKGLGFTLAEIGELLGGGRSAAQVLSAAQRKIDAVDERRRELEAVRSRLVELASRCTGPDTADCEALRVVS
jgi:MerR family mercuric resistance operon transcriptional regulator